MSRAFNPFDPFGLIALATLQQKLMMGAMETIWTRSSQMAQGTMTPVEAVKMMVEKPTAFTRGFGDAAMAMSRGSGPFEVMNKALTPMTTKASANAKRLRRKK